MVLGKDRMQGERDFDVTALVLASNLPSLAWLMYPENGINISIYLYLNKTMLHQTRIQFVREEVSIST